jgi:tetratricopeptide (TPR) repeat protein
VAEFRALTGLWFSDSCYDEQDHGVSTARRLLANARDDRQRLTARFALGNSLFWIGAFDEASDHLQAATEMADRLEGEQPLIVDRPSLMARAAHCWTLWFLDRVDEAEAVFSAGYQRAETLDEHYSTCYLLTFGANLYRCMGDPERVAELSETILTLARRHRFALWEGVGNLTRAWAAAHLGGEVEPQEMQTHFAILQDAYPGGLVTFRAIIAETLIERERYAAAREQIDAALSEMQRTREIYFEPELHRLRATCLAAQGADGEPVEQELEKARQTADALASPPLQRRARISLARWRSSQ